jgi:7-carboxy-7-deazaguanine synthase
MRINEIFYSLQGEGHFTGTPAVFVRTSGCNTRCPFCDTQHLMHTEMTEQTIVDTVLAYPARHVVITGGEPTLQLTASLVAALHSCGCFVQIETNGSLPLPDGCDVDWVTCSPKNLPIRIQRIDELKVLFMHQDMSHYDSIKARDYRLQPLDSGDAAQNEANVNATIQFILDHPKWHLSLQTHKMLNIR